MSNPVVQISVVICTYNPDAKVFERCLDSVKKASEEYWAYEVVIVDNNSTEPIASRENVKSFLQSLPQGRVINEENQGLTPARLRGIAESTGKLIIFVDDDNIIDGNYFRVAAAIATDYPFIGAFSGRVTLEYDKEPESWTRRYWGMLIHRELEQNVWSNVLFDTDTMPNGAGLCVTRDVAEHYLKLCNEGKRNFTLDRSKDSLLSGGDNDLAMCACDVGKGMGLFKDLHLKHYIPSGRFTLDYLSRLAYGIYYSSVILLFMRTGKVDRETVAQKIKHLIRMTITNRRDRIIQNSCKRGLKDARAFIESRKLAVS